MSEAKHTPGPWAVAGRLIVSAKHGSIGAVDDGQPNVEANARLIAAAPDLLAALKALYGTEPGNSIERGQAIAMAECAIAKAEGRAA